MRRTVVGLAFAAAVTPALAVDGGIGRTITATWVLPSTGVVGPDPGFGLTVLPFGHMGAIGGSRLDPVSGVIVTNDQPNAAKNVVIPGYVYKTDLEKVSFASAVMVPVNW